MTEKTITVCGKDLKFKASAALPRLYRTMFGRDAFKDMEVVERAILGSDPASGSGVPADNNEILENIAYIMAKHADPDIPDTVEEWLEQFDVFSIYEIIPVIPSLWYANMKTNIKAKKKTDGQNGK